MVGMAQVLKGHIVEQKLYTNISGKNYVHERAGNSLVDYWAHFRASSPSRTSRTKKR
jgi:hypothetical protein